AMAKAAIHPTPGQNHRLTRAGHLTHQQAPCGSSAAENTANQSSKPSLPPNLPHSKAVAPAKPRHRHRKQQVPSPEDCMKLNPSFVGIALSSLLAIDLWASKRLGVCAGEGSAWGSARPLMKVIEVSGHGIPWLLGTFYGLCQSDSSAAREVLLNLLFGEAGGCGGGTPGTRQSWLSRSLESSSWF
uniref:Uncharacterized protein n=1 Tax=Cyanistes caeruleus TaxID=156563 RepID=A0A8C0VQ92_CYACU